MDGDPALRAVLWKNVDVILHELEAAGAVLAAWGAMGYRAGAWLETVLQELRVHAQGKLLHLGTCANGHPKHPLARGKHKVPKDASLLPWGLA